MSTLQRSLVNASVPLDFYLENPCDAEHLFLLLHGFDDRPHRFWRLARPLMPANAAILAPCGPFPIPHRDADRLKLRFAWYFYDVFEKSYHIDQQYPSMLLRQLIADLKLDHLPCTIIGHSQGGYLAPFAGQAITQTKRIIGINCEFRHQLLPARLPFELVSCHASGDPVVSIQSAREHHEQLMRQGNRGEFITCQQNDHQLSENIIHSLTKFFAI